VATSAAGWPASVLAGQAQPPATGAETTGPEKAEQSAAQATGQGTDEDQGVISDEAFRAALPEISKDDPQLGEELESLEEFERRFNAQTSTASETESREGGQVSPPSGWDPRLNRPLEPLDQFELREYALSAPAQMASGGEDTLRYRWQIEGLDGAQALAGMDLKGRFEGLSNLEQGDGKADNIAMLTARVADDRALLERLLKAQGYYDAAIDTRIDPVTLDEAVDAIATITVDPGERFTFAEIRVEADPTQPADLIKSSVILKPGDPIVADDVLENEAVIAKALPENGYPFAAIGERDVLLDAQTAEGIYTLPVEIGPRSRIGGFAVAGDEVFDAQHIAEIARIETGELYDGRYIDDLRRALTATGLLRSFSVEPKRTGEALADGTEKVTILVDQAAGPARTLAGTVGYGTGRGFTLEGSWSHRNLFPPEGALTGSLVAGTLEQGASVNFRRANAGRRDRSIEVTASALRSNFDAFEATTGRIGALYSYVSTPIWQKRVTWALGAEVLASVEEAFDPRVQDLRDETYFIGSLTGQIGLDTSDDLLNPTRGFRLEALVQPEGSLDGGLTPYVRAIFDGSAYAPVGENIVLAGRMRAGSIIGADRVDIAPSRRLYAGGGGSVRGFGFQQLGPKEPIPNSNFDPDDPEETADPFVLTPIGGRSVVEGSAEVRYRFGDYGVVAFVDAGQVYRDTAPAFSDIRFGVGLGARVYTSFGPIRVDVATPVNRRSGEGRLNVYVSIGQAF
jgi:translocation and assembly module TamA